VASVTPEEVAAFAIDLPAVTEEQPFGPGVDVYKVEGKIFAILTPERTPRSVSLKCEPALAQELRQQHAAVAPGYHLNKKHWNTVELDGDVPPDELQDMIVHSYDRVVAGMPRAVRLRLDRP